MPVVTGVNAGTTIVTYTSNNGCSNTVTVYCTGTADHHRNAFRLRWRNDTLTGSGTAAAVNALDFVQQPL